MTAFKCPTCGIGEMVVEVVADHRTKLGGVPVQIKDARIAKCNHCDETSVSAKELERWERLQQEQLQQRRQVPSPAEVRRIRESLGFSVADLAALVGVTRQTVYAWERVDTGGMQLGPAALVVKLLGEERAGRIPGVTGYLVSAAQDRGHELEVAQTTEKLDDLQTEVAQTSVKPRGLRDDVCGLLCV
ncbi:MAG: type II TA system antitoxin MqsA family protein [Planctomycetota bacterium]|jgi:putative zinc finger/helix-turn-helix YgiT family protein